MGNFFKKVKDNRKANLPTILLFTITFILQSVPVGIGMLFAVGMSTDSGVESLSVYILEDLISLISMAFLLPLFLLIVCGQWIPLAIMFCSRKKVKYNIKLYLILLFIQCLPFNIMLIGLHANTSLEYRNERINEIQINNGKIVAGTTMYDLLSRYLELDNIDDIRDMAKQDKLVLSYDYIYITDYLDYIGYKSREGYSERITSIYNQDFPKIDHVEINKYILSYLDMVSQFIDLDMTVEEVHNKIKGFMNKKIEHSALDDRSVDDDLEYSLPLIIAYENINILEKATREHLDDKDADLILKTGLDSSKYRVKMFVEGNSQEYQYGQENPIKNRRLYKKYCHMIDNLKNEDILTKDKVINTITSFSKKNNLDLENDNLNKLQILL